MSAPETTPSTAARALAFAAVLAVVGLLAGGFALALPDAVKRQATGRDNRIHALCDEALHPEGGNDTIGALPVDLPVAVANLELKDWAGRGVKLSDLRGRVVLVNFWATWCPTCVVEMPSMEKLAKSMAGKDLTIAAVSVDEDWPTVRKFFAGGSSLTVLLDAKKEMSSSFGTTKFPETFLIDRDGRVLYYVVSDRDWSSPSVKACLDALVD